MARDAASEQSVSLEQRNIDSIARLEHAALGERSKGERAGRAVIRAAGRPWSIAIHAACFVAWIVWNTPGLMGHRPIFDPTPYPLLELGATLEAIILALLILMSQNRLQREADHRAHLNLQISMMTEMEGTKILQTLHALGEHLRVPSLIDDQMNELKAETDPARLAEAIRNSIPHDGH